jgi:3-oxoacyl-[acyl-carrier-protein] synthase II
MIAAHPEAQPRRVVITGMGIISPVGNTPEELWTALVSDTSGVEPWEWPGKTLPVAFAGQASQFAGKIESFGPLEDEQKKAIRKGLKVMSRECQMGVAAAQLALGQAGITPGSVDPARTGVVFGVDYMLTMPEEFAEGIRSATAEEGRSASTSWPTRGMPQMSPLWLLKYLPNMPASHVAIYNDFRGPNNSITLREAAANMAVGESLRMVASGRADRMVAGGTGTRLHPSKLIHCLQQTELASPNCSPARASRPFDRDRTGMVLGEGAGAIVLEELGAAQARGATIFAEVVGAATASAIGPNLTTRTRQAFVNVLRVVLADAKATPQDIGHIHAHGLSTHTSDLDESLAIAEVFGERPTPPNVVAAKGHFGNLGAGSGLVELVASVLALRHTTLFPVLNCETPDPACPIRPVTDTSTPSGNSVINLSITPQGQASAVLVRRFLS